MTTNTSLAMPGLVKTRIWFARGRHPVIVGHQPVEVQKTCKQHLLTDIDPQP